MGQNKKSKSLIKVLEENLREYLCDMGIGNGILDKISKAIL